MFHRSIVLVALASAVLGLGVPGCSNAPPTHESLATRFAASPLTGSPPLTVGFDWVISASGAPYVRLPPEDQGRGPAAAYLQFGDGSRNRLIGLNLQGQSGETFELRGGVDHTYDEVGDYTATLGATNNQLSVRIRVVSNLPTFSNLRLEPDTLLFDGGEVTISAKVEDGNGTVEAVRAEVEALGVTIPLSKTTGDIWRGLWEVPFGVSTEGVTYAVVLFATDNDSNEAESAPLTLTIEEALVPPGPPGL